MSITLSEGQLEIYRSMMRYEPESAYRYVEYLKSIQGKGTAHERPNRGRRIKNLTTGEIYDSTPEAADRLGLHVETIRKAIRKGITAGKQRLQYL